jgi:hypothetical protein
VPSLNARLAAVGKFDRFIQDRQTSTSPADLVAAAGNGKEMTPTPKFLIPCSNWYVISCVNGYRPNEPHEG